MTKLKIVIVCGLIAGALAVSLYVRSRTQDELEQKQALERQQAQQLTQLSAEQQRLTELVSPKTNTADRTQEGELRRLRAEADALRKQTNELGARLQVKRRSTPGGWHSDPQPPEYYEALHKMSAGKGKDAMNLALAFHLYAMEHSGGIPTSFDQVASYLRDEHLTLSGTNDFEIVFRGTPVDLKVPTGSIAVLRDRQIWSGPDGQPTRVYAMADGSVQTIRSDDNFQAWEAEHIYSPSPASQ